jgi:hypothetical protein
MNKWIPPTRLLAVCFALGLASVTFAQVQGPATVQLEFTNANLSPPHWVLKIQSDRSGEYDADPGQPPDNGASQHQATPVRRPIQFNPEFVERVFATARQRRFFDTQCESRLKVAFQGVKRLSYEGPDGKGACEYNYSKDKEIQALGDSLIAVASTLQFGARLEMLMQHDRLGMDKEMEDLVSAAHDGNAQEMEVIQDTLERIANDEQILERVRRKARLLLTPAH